MCGLGMFARVCVYAHLSLTTQLLVINTLNYQTTVPELPHMVFRFLEMIWFTNSSQYELRKFGMRLNLL